MVAGYMVCDGHSGSLCVEHIIQTLPVNLQKCLSKQKTTSEDSLRAMVNEACVITDDEFLANARQMEVLDGSTMIMALFWDDGTKDAPKERIMIANVGDCRAVLGRADARDSRPKGLRLSDDH